VCYEQLPAEIQNQADKKYTLFTENPLHPALRLKAVGPFWAVRITRGYRALALRDGDLFTWIWIGSHDEYEEILKHA
jgi:hypothetical protein